METDREKNVFDVVLSFAGEDSRLVEQIADYLEFFGVKVFYSEWERHKLVGEDLYAYLADIYRKRAKYCVIFVSKHYVRKAWPRHERKFAQARAFETETAYIIPIKVDDTECPGIPPTIGYIDSRHNTPSQIAIILVQKLGASLYRYDVDAEELNLSRHMTWAIDWDGSVDAHGKISLLYVGRILKKKLTYAVWSPTDDPLEIENLRAQDNKGELRTEILGRTETSCEFGVHMRRALSFGQTLVYDLSYRCKNYYRNVTDLCKDNFTASLPIKLWEYEFVFPQDSVLKIFRMYRRSGDTTLRQAYSTTVKDGRPVALFSLKVPKPGSILEIEFKIGARQ